MAQDVIDFQKFYDTELGHIYQSRLQSFIQNLWPDLKGQFVLGLGYPFPYLEGYLKNTERLCVMTNAPQGVIHWPSEEKNLTALIDFDAFPIPDQSVDCILVIHGLEYSQNLHEFFRELWRVLKSNGRLLVITPNRRSFWAQLDDTPLGYGNPYTMTQLTKLIQDHQFSIIRSMRGLYVFPSQNPLIRTTFPFFESIGPTLLSKFSGIVAVEATKQLYASFGLKEKRAFPAALSRARSI